jgi:hypothetical protein
MRETPYFTLGGGLDLVTPIIQMPDGRMIAGDNFEPWINGGYRRMRGFERFDGRPKPSASTWAWFTLADASSYSVGDVITGDTSGATGTIVAIGTDTYVNEVAVTKITGTFTDSEAIDTATTTISNIAFASGPTVPLEEAWRLAAEDDYRDDITAVPGSGPVRGCFQCRDRVYAIRDNAGATAGVIHKATSSGWDDTQLTMTTTLYFDSGSTEPTVGETVTGATSAATGVVHRVVLHSGSYGGGDAAGYIAMTTVTGTFQDNEILDGSTAGADFATAASDPDAFSLPVGGHYDFHVANFFAGSDTYRLYACAGNGPAFEIDEDDIVTPILLDLSLGDSPDENNPYLVESFDGALWLMFPGGSLQKSAVGLPLTFNGFLGAAEFGLGDEGTGLINSAGRVLVAFTRSQTHGFFPDGTGSGYVKRLISQRSGCIQWSEGALGTVLAVDDSGLISLARVEQFGDFANATISDLVQPLIVSQREAIIGTQLIRESNQYRVLFASGTGIIARILPDGGAEFASFNMDIGINQTLSCAYSCEDESSVPRYYMGSSDGFVYECEKSRSWDGRDIESFMRLPFNHQGSPAVHKRYRLAEVELKAERRVVLLCAQDRDFGDASTGTSSFNETVDTTYAGGALFDISEWDESYFDANEFDVARFELRGTGRNVSLLLYHKSAFTEPFIAQGVILHFDPRRVSR